MPEEIPPPSLPPPIDIPADDDDDNFWDFYDKPFNKPAWNKYSNLLLISLFKEKSIDWQNLLFSLLKICSKSIIQRDCQRD